MNDKERLYICGHYASSPYVGKAERKDSYLGQKSSTWQLECWLAEQPSLTLPIPRQVVLIVCLPGRLLLTNYYLALLYTLLQFWFKLLDIW